MSSQILSFEDPVANGSTRGGMPKTAEPPPVGFGEAIAAYEAGDRERLLPRLEKTVHSGTGDPRLWHLHGLILREMERREEALESLQQAARMAPGSANIAHALARTLLEAGLPSSDAYGRALRLMPGDREIVAGLAAAFVAQGEPETAISGLERILARSPHWVEGHVLLAKLRWAQGEREGFARSFDEALRELPNDLNLRREQLIVLLHAEQFEEVLQAVAAARAALGDHLVLSVNEAVAYSEMGETEKGEQLFAAFADLDDALVQIRRIRLYLRSNRPEVAAEIIEPWLQRHDAFMFWPYASLVWRQIDERRWQWLEGDERFVGVYDIADRLPPLDVLAETLRKLHTLSGQPLEQSLRGGTQTDGNLFMHVDPVIVRTREAIRETIAEHVAKFPGADPGHPLLAPRREEIRFQGAWSVRLDRGGYHANHVHPAGWISSALYIVVPQEVGQGDAGILTLGDPSSTTFPLQLPALRTVQPKPGRLALFPSYMWHGTRPFAKGERMTVAFDVARPE